MQPILDEEERSIEAERSCRESSIDEQEEKEPKSSGNSTTTQKKLGLDINIIGARKDALKKPGVRPKKCPL